MSFIQETLANAIPHITSYLHLSIASSSGLSYGIEVVFGAVCGDVVKVDVFTPVGLPDVDLLWMLR